MSTRPADIAVGAVRRRAGADRSEACARFTRAVGSLVDADGLDRLSDALSTAGRLTINFHPDRTSPSGSSTAAGLLHTGRYLSQWSTGTSSGMRFAFDGGDRRRWEHSLFDGAYDDADPADVDFPLYGALDLVVDPLGGSPRFGSTYLVLDDAVRARTTLTFGDSHLGPTDVGTVDEPWSLLAALAENAAIGRLLGRELGIDDLLELLHGSVHERSTARDLDHYVEAQVHGGVRLDADVTEIVLDPSFRGTDIEATLTSASERNGIDLRWHGGSELAVDDVPASFRGPTMPGLARRVARPDGVVDAQTLGVAARAIPVEPPRPEGDAPESDLQQIKYLWHCVLALGHDAR